MTITYNTASIVTTDLQLHLDAANAKSYSGSGTSWTDFSANSVGTLTGTGNSYEAVTQPPSFLYQTGDRSQKLSISSSNPIYSAIGTGAFTYEVWANVNIITNYQYLVDLRTNDGTGQTAPLIFFSDTRRLRAWSSSTSYFDSSTIFSTGYTGWKQFAISRTSGGFNQTRIYIDGELNSTGTNNGNHAQNITTVSVGSSSFSTSVTANGYIGAVRFYRRALSASELQQNYNAQRGRYGV